MTRSEQTRMGQRLEELFGQVYARQIPTGWLMDSPEAGAISTLIEWVEWCLRYHVLTEHVVDAALTVMRRQPLKTAEQQMEEFKSAVSPKAGQPTASDSGRGDQPASEQGDSGRTGEGRGPSDRVDAPASGA